jgi:hypothetical protein
MLGNPAFQQITQEKLNQPRKTPIQTYGVTVEIATTRRAWALNSSRSELLQTVPFPHRAVFPTTLLCVMIVRQVTSLGTRHHGLCVSELCLKGSFFSEWTWSHPLRAEESSIRNHQAIPTK